MILSRLYSRYNSQNKNTHPVSNTVYCYKNVKMSVKVFANFLTTKALHDVNQTTSNTFPASIPVCHSNLLSVLFVYSVLCDQNVRLATWERRPVCGAKQQKKINHTVCLIQWYSCIRVGLNGKE